MRKLPLLPIRVMARPLRRMGNGSRWEAAQKLRPKSISDMAFWRRHHNVKQIEAHWDDLHRLTSSIRKGTVTASLILGKLAAYPRQNGLAHALREVGRIEKSLFALDWLQSPDLRRISFQSGVLLA